MFYNTLSNFKSCFKKGVDFVKTSTVGTITAIKNDIREEINIQKEVRKLYKERNASKSTEKSE